MLATTAKLALVATLLALSAVSADAQRVPARCAKARDKVKCTCGVENGAVFVQRPGGGRRMIIRGGADPINEGYARCLMRHGRS